MTRKIRIGVLVNAVYSEYSSSIVEGLNRYCAEKNCVLVIFPLAVGDTTGRFNYQYEAVYNFINKSAIDVLLIATASFIGYAAAPKILADIEKFPKLPVVSIAIPIAENPYVVCKYEQALDDLIGHLVDVHHYKRFLLMNANNYNPESLSREKIIKKALAKRKIKLDEKRIISGNFIYESAIIAIRGYLNRSKGIDFDAVICLNDDMASGCIYYFTENNIRVPEDVAVVGFDNVYATSLYKLNLTSIDQRIRDQAYEAADKAVSIYKKKIFDKETVLEADLVIQGSCGCKPLVNVENIKKEEMAFIQYSRMNRNQLYLLHHFFVESQTPVPLDKLYERLQYSFVLFDISFALMMLYDTPIYNTEQNSFSMPENVRLVMMYSGKKGITKPNFVFNPNECMIPRAYEPDDDKSRIVFQLFAEEYLYGYLVMSFGKYEKIFYQTVYEMLTKEIINSVNISRREDEKDKLRRQNLTLEEYSKRVHMLSYTDELTQKYNRRGFNDLAQKAMEMQISKEGKGLVIFCDMDGLKEINDTYGHDAGDRAIQYEAEVLSNIFRFSDTIGRLGGDEFAILAPNMKRNDFSRVKKAIVDECNKINVDKKEPFTLSLSVGCVEFSSESCDLEQLLKLAAKDQYKEKRRKKKVENLNPSME